MRRVYIAIYDDVEGDSECAPIEYIDEPLYEGEGEIEVQAARVLRAYKRHCD